MGSFAKRLYVANFNKTSLHIFLQNTTVCIDWLIGLLSWKKIRNINVIKLRFDNSNLTRSTDKMICLTIGPYFGQKLRNIVDFDGHGTHKDSMYQIHIVLQGVPKWNQHQWISIKRISVEKFIQLAIIVSIKWLQKKICNNLFQRYYVKVF